MFRKTYLASALVASALVMSNSASAANYEDGVQLGGGMTAAQAQFHERQMNDAESRYPRTKTYDAPMYDRHGRRIKYHTSFGRFVGGVFRLVTGRSRR